VNDRGMDASATRRWRWLASACLALLALGCPPCGAQPGGGAPPGAVPPPAGSGPGIAPLSQDQLPFQPLPPPKDITERLQRLREAARRSYAAATDRAARNVDALDRPIPTPALVAHERFRDAGIVPDTQPLKVTWRLTNPGSVPVRVIQVKPNATCVEVDDPRQTIPPGGEGSISVTFNPEGRMGLEFRELDVHTDALAGGRFRVGFLVETQARVMIDPVVVNLGETRKGASNAGTITIVGRDPTFDVTGIAFDPPSSEFAVTRVARETFTGEDGTRQVRVRHDVSFNAALPLGRHEGVLTISTNDAVRGTLQAAVRAEVVGDLRFPPGRMRLTGIGAGNAWQRLMRAEHRDGKGFRILGVEAVGTPPEWGVVCDVEEFEAGPNPGETSIYSIKVFGVAPTTEIPVTGVLRIRTDVKDQEVVEFPFIGTPPRGAAPAAAGQGSDAPPAQAPGAQGEGQ